MQKNVRHLVTLKDYDGKWMNGIVRNAMAIKSRPQKFSGILEGKTLAMLFEKKSTRTRLSFEAGTAMMGGHAVYLDQNTTHIKFDSIPTEAICISRYAFAILVRPLKHVTLEEFTRWSTVPVINGCSESDHPCQALADIMTIREKFGGRKGIKVVYLGVANNVSNSLSLACAETGAQFVLCTPAGKKGKDPDANDPELMRRLAATGRYSEEPDVTKAVKGANILYTDTWVNMEFQGDKRLMTTRERLLRNYQLNERILELAGPQAFVMHDLPAYEGKEISTGALLGPRTGYENIPQNCLWPYQAENRMWAQMAVMLDLLGVKR